MMDNNPVSPMQLPGSFDWDKLGEFIASVSEQMKETDRRMQETDLQMKETDRRMKETDRRMKETDRRMQETDLQMKETDRRIKETDRVFQETARFIQQSRSDIVEMRQEFRQQIRDITTRFLSQSGHIVEGLMEPSAWNLFKDLGFNIVACWKEMKATNKLTQRRMEVDLFYHDTTEAIAVEVKIKCEREDIDHFLEQMSHFKEVFTRYSDVNVYAAIAALNYNRGADAYAAEKGLFVIRVTDNDVFTVDATTKENKIYF